MKKQQAESIFIKNKGKRDELGEDAVKHGISGEQGKRLKQEYYEEGPG